MRQAYVIVRHVRRRAVTIMQEVQLQASPSLTVTLFAQLASLASDGSRIDEPGATVRGQEHKKLGGRRDLASEILPRYTGTVSQPPQNAPNMRPSQSLGLDGQPVSCLVPVLHRNGRLYLIARVRAHCFGGRSGPVIDGGRNRFCPTQSIMGGAMMQQMLLLSYRRLARKARPCKYCG